MASEVTEASPQHTPKISLSKDRNCPYCKQAFTSSSLGRHLDLFIRPKNPKPADGVHNVDEIRRVRGKITRRRARTSSMKPEQEIVAAEQEDWSQSAGSTYENGASAGAMPAPAPAQEKAPQHPVVKQVFEQNETMTLARSPSLMDQMLDKRKIFLNRSHNWVATGVINDLPPRQDPLDNMRQANGASAIYVSQAETERKRAMEDELETGQAASLALKEVLRSVWEANNRDAGTAIFGFDPLEYDFPGLCLRILPAPPTLFTTRPFPTSESWSVDPPGQHQYKALYRAIEDRAHEYRRRLQAWAQQPQRNGTAADTPQTNFDDDRQRIFAHITDAYASWQALPEDRRRDLWQLETLRAFARADEARRDADSTLDVLRKQVESLSADVQKAQSRWSGYAIAPPSSMGSATAGAAAYAAFMPLRLANDTLKQLNRQGLDIRNWDYDALVDKWKAAIKEERRQQAVANGLDSSPPPPQQQRGSPPRPITPAHQRLARQPVQPRLAPGMGAASSRPPSIASPYSAAQQPQGAERRSSLDGSPLAHDDEGEGEGGEPDADTEMEDDAGPTPPA